jgi:peptidoglycan/LPS O-acetylase OafA/YrhL
MARLDEDRPVGVGRTSLYLPELEALRGWAILLVATFHLDGFVAPLAKQQPGDPSLALAFVRAGHTGVSLFFILSAFLLALPFLDEAAGGAAVSRRRYAARRALRILPLYYAAVVAATLLSAARLADLERGLPYLAFLNSFAGWFTPLPPYSNVWWSLTTEAQFYILLPLLPLCLRSPRGRLVGAALLLLWGTGYGAYLAGALRMDTIAGQMRLGNSLFGRAPLFLLGIAGAALYRRRGARIRDRLSAVPVLRNGGADVLLIALLVGLGMLLRWVIVFGPPRAESAPFHLWHLAEGGLWISIVLVVLLAPLRAKRLVSNPPLIMVGVLSYSIYMWHIPVVYGGIGALREAGFAGPGGWTVHSAVIAVGLGLIVLGLSALTYRWIERPFLVRKERLAAG